MVRYSLEQIRKSYDQKKAWERQFPVNYFLVRPISFYLTYFVIKVTRNPAQVAAIGFTLGALGCFSLALCGIIPIWIGIILICLYSVSDAVDGNIARTTQNVTLFGKYLDGIIGDLIEGNYFFFLGIGLFYQGPNSDAVLFVSLTQDHLFSTSILWGSLVVICRLWANEFEGRYLNYKYLKEGLEPFDQSQIQKQIGTSRLTNRWYFQIYLNIGCLNNQLVALIVLAVFHLEIWFLTFYALFFITKALIFSLYYFGRTKSILTN